MKRIIIAVMALLMVILSLASCGKSVADSKNEVYQNGSGQDMPDIPLQNEMTQTGNKDDRLLVRTDTLYLETKTFSECVLRIDAKTAEYQGYIEMSKINGNSMDKKGSNVQSASYIVRIPAESADAFINSLADLVNFVSRQSSVDDVTQSSYELTARLNSLKIQEERLLAMMEKAEDLSSMLQLEDKLAELRSEIQTLESKLNGLENKVSYATVNITLTEVLEYTEPEPAKEYTFGEKVSMAFQSSWQDFGKGCQAVAVFAVEAFPTLLVLAVIAAVVIVLIRVGIRNNRKKAEARNAAYYASLQEQKNRQTPPASPSNDK